MNRLVLISFIAISLAYAGLLAFHGQWSGVGEQVSAENKAAPVSGFAVNQNRQPETDPIDADKFLVPELYEPAWSAEGEAGPCRNYRAAIVNHHALASDLIVKIMRELARCRPQLKTVIILSPDHFSAGNAPITFHKTPYQTAGSLVQIDTESASRLASMIPSAGEMVEPFKREHGVGALVPFLHRVLPKTRIVPLAVKSSIGKSDRDRLAAWLKSEQGRGAFIMVSSDMSHYLDDSVAIKNDERTKLALADSDIDFFQTAKDAFTDNGPSIAAAIEAIQPSKWSLLGQAISSDYAGSNGFTTTYLVGFWD